MAYQEEEQVNKEIMTFQVTILQQVDENYDPTDFLQGLVPGEAPSFQPPPMVTIPTMHRSLFNLLDVQMFTQMNFRSWTMAQLSSQSPGL